MATKGLLLGPETVSSEPVTHKCMICNFEFESSGILDVHVRTHIRTTSIQCEFCQDTFEAQVDVKAHIRSKHSPQVRLDEWTCNDCDYQGNCASELMKHLKLSGHQPSKSIRDKRMVFEDYRQCYTCKMDFDGYYNLMNHRKRVHPSNKQCRNFLKNECAFGTDCWYLHGQTSNSEETSDNFKCNLCEEEYKGRDIFMKHKKLMHHQYVPSCDKFSAGGCSKGNNECWYVHKESQNLKVDNKSWPKVGETANEPRTSYFREATAHAFPPDQMNAMMKMISSLCSKMEKMEEKFEDIMN